MSSNNPPGDAAAAAEAGWRAMYQLVFEREGQSRMFAAAEAHGVTPAAVKMLLALGEGDPPAMRELAERFRCDPSYVTTLVDGVEQAGWGERRPHPADRRVKVVAMTDAGRAAHAEVRKVLDTPPAWFSVLSPEELEQLKALLTKLQAAQAAEDAG
ncbi:MAG TPA: MarR family winged helix-turn-helix transcriptional regulator [Acidimicrobiales bacterium]|nr:MarR family winged helix-turn-helix transcriptional regulator [Acidimicrobiales bacterium]